MDIDQQPTTYPVRSVEGWIIIVSNLNEEVTEEDIIDQFSEYGRVTACHLNIDRRTGFAKGYALLEYEEESEAIEAINNANGLDMLDHTINVDWAFVSSDKARISIEDRKQIGERSRSRSPERA